MDPVDSVDLTLDLISFQDFGVRITSVGDADGLRDGSLKLGGEATDAPSNNAPTATANTAAVEEEAPLADTGNVLTDDDGSALYTFNAAAANRALELIGKHVGINAFRENVQVNAEMSLIERLQAGRMRAHLRNRDRRSKPIT